MSATVDEVLANSLAEKGGIKPGDKILQISGTALRDIIDYQIEAEEPSMELLIERNGATKKVTLARRESEPIGIKFSSSLFDNLRKCQNNCVFCFLDQMPKGLRKTLYVRDDDFRLSFLYGNFVTLTNASKQDIDRIVAQRLSPLYVSLHCTNSQLREQLLRPKQDNALEYLSDLVKAGIEIHIQIVLCPRMNDSAHLKETLQTLESDFSQVKSIGIVPVGLTKLRQGLFPLRLVTPEESLNLIQEIQLAQDRFLKDKGTSWVFLADEFYLNANQALPPFDHYEDFFQLENGIGITRKLVHEIEENLDLCSRSLRPKDHFAVITGTLAAPILETMFKKIQTRLGGSFDIIGIPNHFFGESITVAGLIAASDILDYFKRHPVSGTLLIPEAMFEPEGMFLDNIAFCDFASMLKAPVEKMPIDGKMLLQRLSNLGGKTF